MFGRFSGQRAGAVAAALIVIAASGFGAGTSHAQFNPKDLLNNLKKGATGKGATQQPPRKGPIAVPGGGPNRFGMQPRGPMTGPQGAGPKGANLGPQGVGPQGLRGGPNASGMPGGPNAQGLRGGPNASGLPGGPNVQGLRGGPNAGPNNPRFGNVQPGQQQPGNRMLGNQPGQQFGNRGPGGPGNNQFGNRGPNNQFGNRGPNNQFGNRGGFGNQGNRFGNNNQFRPRGFTDRNPMFRAVNARTPQMRMTQRFTHRSEMFAVRNRMPVFPLPGERGFSGIPPVAETRYVAAEMVCQWGPDITPQRIEEIARQHNLTILAVQRSVLTGQTVVHFRIEGGRSARNVVQAMEGERIVSQPNYVYVVGQAAQPQAAAAAQAAPPQAPEPASADSQSGGSEQYVANKLKLAEVHKIATGKGVTVAVIDSEIDQKHPELANGIAERFDAVGKPDKPHLHGTGMAGAIVSQGRLLGVAPGARTLAVHAFSTGATQQSPQATTQSIVAGLDWAIGKGARIINMSFAGPQDPILALALKKAYEKGAILIAAVGNAGPKSPPLYPAADKHVIGVAAVDENDKPYKNSVVGVQVAVAAPGVDVMVPAPSEAYQLSTGTSVAAAHVSGVAALLLERHPDADAQLVLEVLTSSATRPGGNKRDDKIGWGLIDPLAALAELDARVADVKVAAPAKPPTAPTPAAVQAAAPARPTPAQPAAAVTRPALPRPGIYVPKQ